MKLLSVTIDKYKCIETTQSFKVEEEITVLVGMNESGKTSALEAIAKTNYFQSDEQFKFNTTHDYPRKEKKKLDKSGDNPVAVTCVYSIPQVVKDKIAQDIGVDVFNEDTFSRSTTFSNTNTVSGVKSDFQKFIDQKTKQLGISSKTLNEKLYQVKSSQALEALIAEYTDETYTTSLATLKKYFENKWKWTNDPLNEYITRIHLNAHLPKYLYYDEYYSLPSRISIEDLKNDKLASEEIKTAKALFELADISIDEILNADSYEDFKAELEATQAIITNELFNYWETNKNLEIVFDIDKIEGKTERTVNNGYGNQTVTDVKIVNHVLDIRVKNRRSGVSLPLRNRSKGFNWFFSFLVWFKKIQEDKNNNYILLLDEPGLNLHAAAQSNLLKFFKDLSADYQIIYTTHSPFMIKSENLNAVRTVLETEAGSKVSESVQEKDDNTLFPLQAALGYNIAQNLFISEHNLLVEGVSDLVYLQLFSNILQENGRVGLDSKVTIVPVGGLDKVSTFISLMRSNDLKVVCLLDTFKDVKGKAKLEDLIEQKIISEKKIRFFNEYLTDYSTADIEDLFAKEDYMRIFNLAFPDKNVTLESLDERIKPILIQLSKVVGDFNHYRPANKIAASGVDKNTFSEVTLTNFENVFKDINKLFK